MIASDGAPLRFLRQAYPDLRCFELPGYGISYPARGSMAMHMLRSSPGILSAIRAEHHAVRKIAARERVQVIISDNRYGCYVPGIRSILLTHQVHIRIPASLRWAGGIVRRLNRRMRSRFDAVWIPDLPVAPGLSGDLSHPAPAHGLYVGPLSRFSGESPADPCDILAVCSGPEPQRTLLEDLLRDQMRKLKQKSVLVRGVVDGPPEKERDGDLTVYNWLPSGRLEALVRGAGIVVSRPGYSTVMDLARLGKKAVFIPTPGQTEQEYLACQYSDQRMAGFETQDQFNLARALRHAEGHSGFEHPRGDLLEPAVREVLNGLAG